MSEQNEKVKLLSETKNKHHHHRYPNKNSWEARRGKSRRRNHPQKHKQQQVAPKKPPCCSVCSITADPKYKCPQCRATYCSVDCCRTHKKTGCGEGTTNKASSKTTTSKYLPDCPATTLRVRKRPRETASHDDNDDPGWQVTEKMKQAVKDSEWLRNELANDNDKILKRLLVQVYEASNRVTRRNSRHTEQHQVLEHLKSTNPQFRHFLDKLMVLTGVLERQGTDADVPLMDWLSAASSESKTNLYPLVLKPLVRMEPTGRADSEDADEMSSSSSSTSVASVDDNSSDESGDGSEDSDD